MIFMRFIYFNDSTNDFNQLRIFPQLTSIVTYPLSKKTNNRNEILRPVIMPILAPYNNYTGAADITNDNIFSLNRVTSLSQWESGPRINYGINWLVKNNNLNINTSIGQSAKIRKTEDSKKSSEISVDLP